MSSSSELWFATGVLCCVPGQHHLLWRRSHLYPVIGTTSVPKSSNQLRPKRFAVHVFNSSVFSLSPSDLQVGPTTLAVRLLPQVSCCPPAHPCACVFLEIRHARICSSAEMSCLTSHDLHVVLSPYLFLFPTRLHSSITTSAFARLRSSSRLQKLSPPSCSLESTQAKFLQVHK